MNGNSLTLKNPGAGSAGTETNGFQFLKDSTIVIKNGTLKSEDAKILVQNYSNLTLDNVKLIGSPNNQYTLSNNFGEIIIKNNTEISACDGNVAFDVYYGMFEVYDEGVHVTIADNSVVIGGKVEFGKADRADAAKFADNASLTTPVGFKLDVTDGYSWTDNGDGTQTMKATK